MADEKVRRLIRWNSQDAQGIADQIAETVKSHIVEGRIVGVVACVVYAESDGGGQVYETAFSRMPVEVTLWAAEKIKRRLFEVVEGS